MRTSTCWRGIDSLQDSVLKQAYEEVSALMKDGLAVKKGKTMKVKHMPDNYEEHYRIVDLGGYAIYKLFKSGHKMPSGYAMYRLENGKHICVNSMGRETQTRVFSCDFEGKKLKKVFGPYSATIPEVFEFLGYEVVNEL